MNRKQKQFDENISRLVKSTRDSQIPSEAFAQDLVEKGLKELKNQQTGRKWLRRIIPIAALLIFCVTLFSIIIPATKSAKMRSKSVMLYKHGNDEIILKRLDGTNPPPPPPPPAAKPIVNQPTRTLYYRAPMETVVRLGDPGPGDSSYLNNYYSVDGSHGMAHGGTTPPNNQAYDAMFFKNYGVNPFVDTEDDHLSTFAIDVDTGSYTLCRSYLQDGHLPPNEAVRVEEFINYFQYDYPAPQEEAFAVYTEAIPWSFGPRRNNSYLMRIGLKGMEISEENRKPAILTFVIDVSGSMNRENRLGLVKQSLEMLVKRLRREDRIGIAVYGSRGHAVLEHTGLDNKPKILRAIHSLSPEGSTNAEEGITIGYEMAEEAFTPGCINRVILCSDGVANVGRTGPDQILAVIKEKADKGITLSALGFGMGNYNDVLMERLGDKGNGYYAYIDTLEEAKRLFGENLTGTLQVIARDVKVQVDFNPDVVRSYRLIGYENRDVADIDFRNDKVDGGEIGAGHTATALYELKLWPDRTGTVATTYIRYKDPDTFEVTEISRSFDTFSIATDFDSISRSFALASVAGEFAEVLRESYWARGTSLEETLLRAQQLNLEYPGDHDVIELVNLISRANKLIAEKQPREKAEEPGQIPLEE